MRRGYTKGLRYTIDLSKIADRANPRRVEAPIYEAGYPEPVTIEWGDGTSEILNISSGKFPTHTYADGTGDVFTVKLRSATGKLPYIAFNGGQSSNIPSLISLSTAVVSVDHYAGMMSLGSLVYGGYLYRNCANLKYVDTRLAGSYQWDNLYYFCGCHGSGSPHAGEIEQPIESFCFDFSTNCTTLSGAFVRQLKLKSGIPQGFFDRCGHIIYFNSTFYSCAVTSVPSDLLDKCTSVSDIGSLFRNNTDMTGAPYIFWKEDGSIDTDRFPDLTAEKAADCYLGCSDAIRAQVPEAYGGTMTVS